MGMVATTVMEVIMATLIMRSVAIQGHMSMMQQLQLKPQARVQQFSKQHQLWQAMSSRLQTNLLLLLLLLRQQQVQQYLLLHLLLLLQMSQTQLTARQLMTSSSSRKLQVLTESSKTSSSSSSLP
jgi:Na+(H+)/acetate symporter ActP